MGDFCPVELDFSDSSSLHQYEASGLVEYLNSWSRFGFPKEFPDSNDGNQSLPVPYITGIFMWSSIFSSLLIMYILILVAYNSHQNVSDERQTGEALQQINHNTKSEERRQEQINQEKGHTGMMNSRSGTNMPTDGGLSAHQHLMRVQTGNDIEGNRAQVYNQLHSQHILRHLQTTDSSLGTLPQSQYISPTVSRKRLLEAYFDSIMNTSTMLKLGLWNDDNNKAEVRPQPNERHLRVATGQAQTEKPRQRWSFSQVYESPKEEGDDGSTFQPPPIRQTRTFPADEDSSIASASIYTNSRRIEVQETQYPEENPMKLPSIEDDGDISPRTIATASSGSDSSGQHFGPASKFKSVRFKQQHSSALEEGMVQEREPDSCFRLLTLFAGCMLLLFVILLCSDGLLPLGIQSDAMMENWQKVKFSSLETAQILHDVQQVQSSLYNRSKLLYRTLDQSCPAISSSLCSQVDGSYSCNVRGIPLDEDWEVLLGIGIQPKNITAWAQEPYNWTLADQDLSGVITMPFESTLNVWKWILRAAGICNAILFVLILLVLWSIALPKLQFEIQTKFVRKSRTFLWLFWISTVCVWCVAIASLAGTFALSDFCVESPSDHSIDLLFGNSNTNGGQSTLTQEFWKYHIDGCPADEYPDSLRSEVEKWLNILGPTKDLQDALQRLPIGHFDFICGDSDQLQDLQVATSNLQSEVCSLVQVLTSLSHSLKCAKWYPHFESIIYESVCEHGTLGVGWTAMAEWIIVVMSLTVWTFDAWRSSLPSREHIHESSARRMHPQHQKKQRLQDDKLGKFPVIPSRSPEAPLVKNRQIPVVQDARLPDSTSRHPPNQPDAATFAQLPDKSSFVGQRQIPAAQDTNKSNPSDSATSAQFPDHSAHSVEEREGRLPLDPPALDATDGEETVASEAWGESQPQYFPDAASMTGSHEIETSTDQISTGGLEMNNWELNESYIPTHILDPTRLDTNDTLQVPRTMAGSGRYQMVASSLVQVEDDSSDEEDLCSL